MGRLVRRVAAGVAVLAAMLLGLVFAAGKGWLGHHQGPGTPTARPRPAPVLAARRAREEDAAAALDVAHPRQILFGDLHVHTTFSLDAFMLSLPVLGGEGAHPPADACDFARYCSALDFWSITDHAFSVTPRHWRETVDAIRQCNAVAGEGGDPDMVSFLGWEWTQVGKTPADHYGHKNVILAATDDAHIPTRPIASMRAGGQIPSLMGRGAVALRGGPSYEDLATYLAEWAEVPHCDPHARERDLPADCLEMAATPADLFRRLDDWGFDALVIPHGTTWGFYTPPGSSWDKQLRGAMHDPERQRLLEIDSGHGDGEVYRDWRAVRFDAAGKAVCPEPRPDYLPTCWRAGEIIRERCLRAGVAAEECAHRAAGARDDAAAAGVAAHLTVPGAAPEDWLDAGQCRDCREPAFNYRPGGSAQYIEAIGDFSGDPAHPRHFRFGFIGSSDNHFARAGTGYKEVQRRGMTENVETGTPHAGPVARLMRPPREAPAARSRPFHIRDIGFQIFETERQASFFLTGGLVGLHAEGRSREAIWAALRRREVYATTGRRILLWFDLLDPPGTSPATAPMGSEVTMAGEPIFQVRAAGSFEQKPGCPDDVVEALGAAEVDRICHGECYNPSDRRRPITRIEIVRIRPQAKPGEDVAHLIDDPWRAFPCRQDGAGCSVTFHDPEFPAARRDTLYYARVFEAPDLGIDAENLRCDRDAEGNCVRTHPCPGPDGAADDCLAPYEPRAWSSPIYVDFDAAAAGAAATRTPE